MAKLSKRVRAINEKIEACKVYPVEEALNLIKELSTVKFAETVDVAVNLGIDPRKSDQVVRGATTLPNGSGKQIRVCVFAQGDAAEAAKAARCLGVVHREQLGFPNRKLFDSFDVRVALAKVFRRYRPRLILGIGDKTPMASPDHAQAMMITEAAVFYSRLTKWNDVFDNLPEHTIPHLLTYFLFTGVADLPAGCWPMIVNIEGHLQQKMEAIHCYASQFPPEKKHVFKRVEALSQTVGFLGGCAEGELLAGSRIPCTTDLMRLL